MATTNKLETWLSYLQKTMHFESVFRQVFERIVGGRGHGLMILQGPSKIANKSFFLKMVKAFQKGVPPNAKVYFSSDLQRLLAEVDTSDYQCVDIKEDCPIKPHSNIYRVPLYLALPFSLASASQKRGLKKGHKIVILCDDLQEFIPHNQESNMTFLKQLAELTYNRMEITFLGAYTLDIYGKGLEKTALSSHILPLGYD